VNIALSTFILLLLLLPGLTFRRFYYTEEFSKQYFKSSYGELFASTLVPSIIIHAFCLWVFAYPNYEIDFQVLGTLVSGSNDQAEVSRAFKNIDTNKVYILSYFIIVILLSMIGGFSFKLFIRKLKLDRKIKLFRFQNEWHYLFSGEIYDFERIDGHHKPIDIKYINALVDTSEGPIIYMGILADYVLSKTGGIDRIYLSDVSRKPLKNSLEGEHQNGVGSNYEMPGDFFVIPFDKIINLHIVYYKIAVTNEIANEISQNTPEDEINFEISD